MEQHQEMRMNATIKEHSNYVGLRLAWFTAGVAGIAYYTAFPNYLFLALSFMIAVYGLVTAALYVSLHLLVDWQVPAATQPEATECKPQSNRDRKRIEKGELFIPRFNGADHAVTLDEEMEILLTKVMAARAQGQLDTISENALDNLDNGLRITRFGSQPAKRVMEFLEEHDLIEREGENQAAEFTQLGSTIFPYPTD